jgi:hypothetical protein
MTAPRFADHGKMGLLLQLCYQLASASAGRLGEEKLSAHP